MKKKLLQEEELEWSPVVANNAMNRERIAIGINSYEQDIKLNPINFLLERKKQDYIQWTDLCCGRGNALIQASKYFEDTPLATKLSLIGIDLVDFFSSHQTNILTLNQLSIREWQPDKKSDLISIVHGLHYIGDKLGILLKVIAAIKEDGVFIGNIDLDNIKIKDIPNAKTIISSFFKKNHINYDPKNKILKVEGSKTIASEFIYLGADDKAGPNYTGQPVVNSYYRLKD